MRTETVTVTETVVSERAPTRASARGTPATNVVRFGGNGDRILRPIVALPRGAILR